MGGRFLGIFKPLSRFMPEVGKPERKVGFNEKLFWTGLALTLYLIMTEITLYGIPFTPQQGDPFLYLRVIFASHRGSLMELGIGPIVTAGLILQLLAGSGMIQCDMGSQDDRALFTTASKVFSFILIGVQASAYIIGGVYSLADPRMAIVVFLQLLFAGIVLVLLDEMLQKGWGLGSGISLFILAGVAQSIIWEGLSIAPSLGQDPETIKSYGSIPALIQTFLQGQFTPQYLYMRFNNANLPTLLGLFTTIVVFFVVIYAEGVRVEMPISYAGYRGFRSRYPIT